jgi:hypothetical protein
MQKSKVPSPARLRSRLLCGEQKGLSPQGWKLLGSQATDDHRVTEIDHACLLLVCSSAPVRPVSARHYAAGTRAEVRLLIRGFGVQVPGGAPVLTWSFPCFGACMCALVWPVVGRSMTGERVVRIGAAC